MLVYHFAYPDVGVLFFKKREGNRKRGCWYCNRALKHLCTLVLEAEENFITKKRIVCKSSIDCHPSIMEFFWFTQLWFRIQEQIHNEEVTAKSRGGMGGFGSCSVSGFTAFRKNLEKQEKIWKFKENLENSGKFLGKS